MQAVVLWWCFCGGKERRVAMIGKDYDVQDTYSILTLSAECASRL